MHVAIVLPGQSYGPALPVLRYPALVLRQVGADVRVVEYSDPSADDFIQSVRASVRALAADADRVTLVGKSLGTLALAALTSDDVRDDAEAIWITSLFDRPDVAAAAKAKPWRSLYVYGTADPVHDPDAQAAVTATTRGRELAVAGGDHTLEIDGHALATVQAMLDLTRAVLDFVTAR